MKHAVGKMASRFVVWVSRMAGLDLIKLAYANSGIGQSHSFEASGELNFIRKELPGKLRTKSPILFDVGSNRGKFAEMLRTQFPEAGIFCFEPNPNTFQLLCSNNSLRAEKFNIGFGSNIGESVIHFSSDDPTSVQATGNPEIIKTISNSQNVRSEKIMLETIDSFCNTHGIDNIHFLKIDTEGFELEVLRGAQGMIGKGKVPVIQFEFNETSIIQRTFLRDFYLLLKGYALYRLSSRGMIPLGSWDPASEIFLFQNIVAIRREGLI